MSCAAVRGVSAAPECRPVVLALRGGRRFAGHGEFSRDRRVVSRVSIIARYFGNRH